jgi:uncharacterized membrane protein
MEGCSVVLVMGIAIAALGVAIHALMKLKESRLAVDRLTDDVSRLYAALRDLQCGVRVHAPAEAPAEPPPSPMVVEEPPVVAPPFVPEPIPPPVFEPVPEPVPEPIAAFAPPPAEIPIFMPPPPEPPRAAPAPPQPPPRAPKPARSFDWESLVGIKLFSAIAGVALVLAAVFFLKYSVEHGWLSPTIRATLGILTGTALLVICEMRVARGYKVTANAMHGAGIAILYATLFAIHALWHLVPAGAVFFLMLVVTAVAVGLSIRRDSMFIAILGLMGGFATPALLSTGENRPIGLFSYLLLLNFGLAWVAYKKRWPALTVGSTLFTVLYQGGWVGKFLSPSQFPLAAAIFAVFAAGAAAALWLGRRRDDASQRLFDRVSLTAAALPLAFGVFAATVPAYGARYHTLFGFLLLVAAGLASIALVRKQPWLHAIGGGAVLLTFALWTSRSYTPAAWPVLLAWIAAFAAL